MDNPRPEKVAVIDEVRERLDGAAASVVTEYRGLTVAELAQLRRSLSAVGGDYKVFKNTLVRRAIDGSTHAPLEDLLTGPTAIAFVHGDVSAVAKALRDFSRTNAHLVVKGGLLDGALLSPAQLGALADLPSREVLLARVAGAIQAPLSQFAGLLQALPRNLAYGLKALLDQQGGTPEAPADTAPAEEPAAEEPATEEATATEEPPSEEPAAEGPAAAEVPAAEEPVAEEPEVEGAAPEAEEPAAEAEEAPEPAAEPVATDGAAESDE